MRGMLGMALAVVTGFLTFAAFPTLSAQTSKAGWVEKPTPACALLSTAEISKAAGLAYPEGGNGDEEGEGIAGGSGCIWGGASFRPGDHPPMIGFALIRGGKHYTENRRTIKLLPGCKRASVAGVGDAAFFEACPKGKSKRTDPLYVKVGANDFLIEMDIEPPATEASARQTVIAVAKAAAAKLRAGSR
jgi:hypothetical protein